MDWAAAGDLVEEMIGDLVWFVWLFMECGWRAITSAKVQHFDEAG